MSLSMQITCLRVIQVEVPQRRPEPGGMAEASNNPNFVNRSGKRKTREHVKLML